MRPESELREMVARLEGVRERMAETRQQSDAIHAGANIDALKWALGDLGDDDLGPEGLEWFGN